METYAITGVGIYNGLGMSAADSWQNLLNMQTAVKTVEWPQDSPHAFPVTYDSVRATKIAAIAPKLQADTPCVDKFSPHWAHWDPNTRAGLVAIDEALSHSGVKSRNMGVVMSTFGGGGQLRMEFLHALNNGRSKYSPRKVLNIRMDYAAAITSDIYGFNGPCVNLDSACATGIASMDYAIGYMRNHSELDAMLVAAADHMADAYNIFWFQNIHALCASADPSDNRPFDLRRSGFVMGEGAAAMVIEPLSKAQKRGANILGLVLATSVYTLCESDTSPDAAGVGAKTVVQQALCQAGLQANAVDFVNAHATGTPVGDMVEYQAMCDIVPGRVMVSNKGQIGHCMSAAGIMETIYTVLGMQQQRHPGNANLIYPLGDKMILPTQPVDMPCDIALKNSFGFGGRNACAVLARAPS
jgi:3-oxoacyl-[acyl-carrier-protein] synthase II